MPARLFLSVDVAGSTLYKTMASAEGEGRWLTVFRQFFLKFPIMMMGHVGMEFLDEEHLPEIGVWKVMGDEVIFVATPASDNDIALLLSAHFKAMAAYEHDYLTELPLRLKGTAWVAAFPHPNIEIDVPEMGGGDEAGHIDYLGPDIDLGFRISKFASPATIAVSLDLVDLVLGAPSRERLNFYLVGREALRGVHFGRPYPVIWAVPSDTELGFMPWDIEDNPMVARAVNEGPASPERLKTVIDGARLYLKRMHGVQIAPISFGPQAGSD